jgi:hypothetical protein
MGGKVWQKENGQRQYCGLQSHVRSGQLAKIVLMRPCAMCVTAAYAALSQWPLLLILP